MFVILNSDGKILISDEFRTTYILYTYILRLYDFYRRIIRRGR